MSLKYIFLVYLIKYAINNKTLWFNYYLEISVCHDLAVIKTLNSLLLGEKILIIQKGSFQFSKHDLSDGDFPQKFGVYFSKDFYWRLYCKERNHGDWLSYSISFGKIFCLHCVLFGNNVQTSWTKDGFSSWHRLKEYITMHENYIPHIDASLVVKLKLT